MFLISQKMKIVIRIIYVIKNWPKVFLVKFGFLNQAKIHFRNGYIFELDAENFGIFTGITQFFRDFPDGKIKDRITSFRYKNKNLIMDFGSAVAASFCRNEWDKFLTDEALRKKTILDFGCSIGDTIIDFALRGTKRVIGFEILPYRYSLALKNILLNNMNEFCSAVNIAVAGECGKMSVNKKQKASEHYSGLGDITKKGGEVLEVSKITLGDIVKNYNIENGSIIKSDIQGGEYDVFMNTPNEILKKFSLIVIRQYYKKDNRAGELKNRFESIGFKCKHYKPKKWGCGYLVAMG